MNFQASSSLWERISRIPRENGDMTIYNCIEFSVKCYWNEYQNWYLTNIMSFWKSDLLLLWGSTSKSDRHYKYLETSYLISNSHTVLSFLIFSLVSASSPDGWKSYSPVAKNMLPVHTHNVAPSLLVNNSIFQSLSVFIFAKKMIIPTLCEFFEIQWDHIYKVFCIMSYTGRSYDSEYY
jgi:hypothetical protein